MPTTVVFTDVEVTVEAEPGDNLLELARRAGAPAGSHCGGVCACSKCHVYVTATGDAVTTMEDDERDMIDLAVQEPRPQSRLACQTRVTGEGTCRVAISEESFVAYVDDHDEDRARVVALWRRRPR